MKVFQLNASGCLFSFFGPQRAVSKYLSENALAEDGVLLAIGTLDNTIRVR